MWLLSPLVIKITAHCCFHCYVPTVWGQPYQRPFAQACERGFRLRELRLSEWPDATGAFTRGSSWVPSAQAAFHFAERFGFLLSAHVHAKARLSLRVPAEVTVRLHTLHTVFIGLELKGICFTAFYHFCKAMPQKKNSAPLGKKKFWAKGMDLKTSPPRGWELQKV